MSWVDRMWAGVAPGYAINRIRAKNLVANYEAAKTTRIHKPKKESRGPNTPVLEGADSLRAQARYHEQNNDIVKGALDTLVANTVGRQIIPQFQVKDAKGILVDEVNEQLAALYADWCRHPEVTWEHDEGSAQRLTARTLFRDGEVLSQHLIGTGASLDHGSKVPYTYEMIDPDLLPLHLNESKNRRIVQGVEVKTWGRPVPYHLQHEIA